MVTEKYFARTCFHFVSCCHSFSRFDVPRVTLKNKQIPYYTQDLIDQVSMGREAFIRASIILAACSLDGAKSQRTVACPNSVGEVGYVDITSLNEDMHDEFENITVGGKAPSPPYDYILCPGTVFDGNEMLRPVLNQAQFFCGDRGLSRTCIISGGTQQVIIADSTDPTYQIDVINFFGVAFSDFTESSISAFAGKGTSTSFNECTWKVSYGIRVILPRKPK